MHFAQPWMLWGALAALIPLLIHLLNQRRPKAHPFAPIAFVIRSQRRHARRLRLKRILLYAARTALLLALALAMARPQWDADAASSRAQGPAATAIVLDASLSMRFQDGSSLFERGQEQARAALRALQAEEPATFLLCTQNPKAPPVPGFDRGALRSQIDRAEASYGSASIDGCLELALRSLEDSAVPNKRLVIISDLTTPAFRLDAPAPSFKLPDGSTARPQVVLRDAAEGKELLPNRALIDLKIDAAGQAGPGAYAFTVSARNFSPQEVKDLACTIEVEGQVLAKGFFDLPAQGSAQKVINVRFTQSGTLAGEVRLSADALGEDDRRAFVLQIPKPLQALVINGAPHATRYRDEAFFVEAALEAPGSPVRAVLRDAEAGLKEDFSRYDAVLLLNVAAPDKAVADRLRAYVEAGGGLFWSMGDQIEAEQYNDRFGHLLPRPLRLVRSAAPRDSEARQSSEARPAKLGALDADQLLLAPFAGTAGEGLWASRFYRYMLLEAAGEGDNAFWLKLDDGAPLLALAKRGKGRVALLTTSVDCDWADLAIRTGFLPLMQRLVAYLSGALEERQSLQARVGEPVTLRPEFFDGESSAPVALKAPDGTQLPLTRAEAQPADASLISPVLPLPGTYAVLDATGQALPKLAFAAQLDSAESDLSRLDPKAVVARFGEGSVVENATGDQRTSAPLWTWLMLALVVAFAAEGALLRK